MSTTNNNVGKNEGTGKVCDDIHFDLGPTAGADALGTRTGMAYTTADLLAIAIARGMVYTQDGLPVAATDEVSEIELDLKPIGGEGYNEGDDAQFVIATTADASYVNNGSRTDLDPAGGREDSQGSGMETLPTSVSEIWVCNGSVATVHLRICKDSAGK